jgi:hypothetical protein
LIVPCSVWCVLGVGRGLWRNGRFAVCGRVLPQPPGYSFGYNAMPANRLGESRASAQPFGYLHEQTRVASLQWTRSRSCAHRHCGPLFAISAFGLSRRRLPHGPHGARQQRCRTSSPSGRTLQAKRGRSAARSRGCARAVLR